jgi:Na+/H+ antiporter NhaD/arsenite permease-like protein
MILPFLLLLGMIALGPLLFAEWWGRHYPKVSFALAAVTIGYYLFGLPDPARGTVQHTAHEYVSFIVLIGALFVVSGGIHLSVKGEATPWANVVFLLLGAALANVLGTTGASMVLIRPWLRMNNYRLTAHHVVFFIFIVSNVGGCLTPIGDPPLFLGYLKGIPFWWVAQQCWAFWLVGVGTLVAMFLAVDYRNYLRAPRAVREALAEPKDQWRFEGGWNFVFLAVILCAVFIKSPPFLREIVMAAAATASYFTTRPSIHHANEFNFHPIQEVAILFVGIFATMMPALDWLRLNAGHVDGPTASFYFWGSGTLSSVLDNAPTYLTFLSALIGAYVPVEVVAQVQQLAQQPAPDLATAGEPLRHAYEALQRFFPGALAAGTSTREQIEVAFLLGDATYSRHVVAVSVGAVFFGANTYIGNGPNFMVKAIAEDRKVRVPTFFGYVFCYTLPFMAPMLALVWLLFFRH